MYNHTMLLGRVFMISEVKQHLAMLVLGWVTAWGNPRQDQPFELIFKLLNSRNLLQNIFLFPNHLFLLRIAFLDENKQKSKINLFWAGWGLNSRPLDDKPDVFSPGLESHAVSIHISIICIELKRWEVPWIEKLENNVKRKMLIFQWYGYFIAQMIVCLLPIQGFMVQVSVGTFYFTFLFRC